VYDVAAPEDGRAPGTNISVGEAGLSCRVRPRDQNRKGNVSVMARPHPGPLPRGAKIGQLTTQYRLPIAKRPSAAPQNGWPRPGEKAKPKPIVKRVKKVIRLNANMANLVRGRKNIMR